LTLPGSLQNLKNKNNKIVSYDIVNFLFVSIGISNIGISKKKIKV